MTTPLQCPQCLAPLTDNAKICDYCGTKIFVDSIAYLSNLDSSVIHKYIKNYKDKISVDPTSLEGLLGMALCYLILKNYQLAKSFFEKVITLHPEVAKTYYYYSLAIIAERRIKTIPSKEMKAIESYLNTAYSIDSEFQLTLLLLYIIQVDYYLANGLILKGIFQNDFTSLIDYENMDLSEVERLKSSVRVQDFEIFNI